MADLDDIVQKILLEGDVEIIGKLSELGKQGFETFETLAAQAEAGASKMAVFATGVGIAAAAIIGVAGAVGAFVESQAEAIQQTNLLAKSFGATTAEVSGMEAAFASAGVSTNAFETFAQRLTTTIAREWPAISESIRTASDQQAAAQERVEASTLRVQEAQQNLGLVNQQTASSIANSNLRVQASMEALGQLSQKTFQQMQHDQESAAGAALGLEAAQQHLATLEGRPPSEADKKNLEIAQAKLAIDRALQAQSDADQAQEDHAREAVQKRAAAEQAAADAQLKHEAVINEASVARQKAELQVKEAITARGEAEERASQVALKSIPAISSALQGMIANDKAAGSAIDITQVSVQNLGKGLIAAASAANGGGLPKGFQTLIELTKLLSSEQGKLIPESQRLALVMQLGQQRMQQTGASASELLGVMSRGPAIFAQFNAAAEKATANSEETAHSVEHFKDALETLSYNIQLVNRNLAASALPTFTDALNAINGSLTKGDGLLHGFVAGVQSIGTVIGDLISGTQKLLASIDAAFNLAQGRSFQILLVTIIALVAAFASAWLAIPAAIALVVTAIGFIATAWPGVKAQLEDAWKLITDNVVYQGLSKIVQFIGGLIAQLGQMGAAVIKAFGQPLIDGFVGALKGIVELIRIIVVGYEDLASKIDKAFDATPGTTMKVVLGAIVVAVALFASSLLAIPALILVVSAAVGYIAENWDKVKDAAAKAIKSIQESSIYKFLDGVIEKLKSVADWFKKAFLNPGAIEATARPAGDSDIGSDPNAAGFASGGEVHGPGTKTSDGINARLSDGEFVHQASAVDFWGTEFMHAINNKQFPGFALGGSPTPGVRPGTAGPMPATSVLNLTLEGKSFNGLRGPKDVIDSLAAHAVDRQVSSAGRQPTWVR